ncbi:hypothetical protein Rcae01_04493 [Novipirellula caenicola]|uniref:Uncharacterized protein n=1 Tax=Novipirellula caenicola TaxID=1536901 RepID=A0ABP9VV44_9BACT
MRSGVPASAPSITLTWSRSTWHELECFEGPTNAAALLLWLVSGTIDQMIHSIFSLQIIFFEVVRQLA